MGQPNYSSVSAGVTYSVDDKDDVSDVFDKARQVVIAECKTDPSWIDNDKKIGIQKTIPLGGIQNEKK